MAVTPHIQDFIKLPIKVQTIMNGLSSVTSGEGEGIVKWNFLDDYGVSQRIKVRVFYVHAIKV